MKSIIINIFKFIILCSCIILISILIGVILRDLIPSTLMNINSELLALIMGCIGYCVIILLFRQNKLSIKYTKYDLKIVKFKWILVISVLMLGYFIVEDTIFKLIGLWREPGNEKSLTSLLLIWFGALILAPLFEEYLHRVVIFQYSLQGTNVFFSAIILSMFFALLHRWGDNALSSFVVGNLLCAVFYVTKSYITIVFGHMFNNLLILFFGNSARLNILNISFNVNSGRFQFPIWIILSGFILFLYGLFYFIRLKNKINNIGSAVMENIKSE